MLRRTAPFLAARALRRSPGPRWNPPRPTMKKTELTPLHVAALLIGLLGAVVAVRWVTQWAWLADLFPGAVEMGLVAPLLLLTAALCLPFVPRYHAHGTAVRFAVVAGAALLVVMPVLMLIEHLFQVSLGIDFVRHPTLPTPNNPHPGRVSPNGCVGFLCAGLAMLISTGKPTRAADRAFLALAWGVTLVGLAGLVGHFLRLEWLYRLGTHNRLLPPTAVGLTMLGGALWLVRDRQQVGNNDSFDRHERRITSRSLTVLTLVAIGAGVAGFGMLRESFERTLSDNLLLSARTNAASLANTLDVTLWFPQTLSAQPGVAEAMLPGADPRVSQRVADSLLMGDIVAVRLLGPGGELLARAGTLADQTAWSTPLDDAKNEAVLIWQDGYLLRTETPVRHGGTVVGRLIAEQRLPIFDKVLRNIRLSSDSSDVLLCSRQRDHAVCAPTRFYKKVVRIPMFDSNGKINLPINRALIGESGVRITKDLRGIDVMAAYTPLDRAELAIVLKTDVETLYAPLKDRVVWLLVVLLALVGGGGYALHNRVQPLVRQILNEQRRTRVILDNSHDAFIAIRTDGRVSDWNAEAERTFGWTAAEAIGREVPELIIPPAQREAHRQGFARFLQTGTGPIVNRRIEVMAQDKNGRELPVEMSIASFHDGHGFVAHAFVRDITERRAAQQQLATSEKRLQSVANNIPALISHISCDQRYLFANQQVCKLFRTPVEKMIGRHIAEGRDTELYQSILPRVQAALAGERVTFQGTAIVRDKLNHYESTYVPDIDDAGRAQGFFSMTYDVTERHNNELRLAANEQRLRMITDNLPVLIIYLDREQKVTFMNATFEHWTGVAVAGALNRPLLDVIGPVLYEECRHYIERALAGEQLTFETLSDTLGVMRHLDMVYVPEVDDSGTVVGIYTMTTDVTSFRRIESQLAQLARFDSLTGLPNRHQLNEKLDEALLRSKRSGLPVAALFLDVDRFKSINDTLGHAAGDAVLVEFSRRLKACVRATDTVARLAGDEFVIVLEGLRTIDEAQGVGAKIVDAMAGDWLLGDQVLAVTCSVGIGFTCQPMTGEALLALADKALYRAKAEGRNTYRTEELAG